jgi:hypothetical protein
MLSVHQVLNIQKCIVCTKVAYFNIWLYAGISGEIVTECGIITVYSSLRCLKMLQSATVCYSLTTYRCVAFWSVLQNGKLVVDRFGSRKPEGKRSNGKPRYVFVWVLMLKCMLNRLWGMKTSGMIVRNSRTSWGFLNVTRRLAQHILFYGTTGVSS